MIFIRTWAQKIAAKLDVESFNVFLTGGPGTGKSHLVRCIYEEVNKILSRLSTIPDSPVGSYRYCCLSHWGTNNSFCSQDWTISIQTFV